MFRIAFIAIITCDIICLGITEQQREKFVNTESNIPKGCTLGTSLGSVYYYFICFFKIFFNFFYQSIILGRLFGPQWVGLIFHIVIYT